MELCIEIFMEEIPARMQRQAKIDFLRLFSNEFEILKLKCSMPEVFIGPRRMALHVADIASFSETILEEKRGPKVGAPDAALQGFLKSSGLLQNELIQENGYWFAKIQQQGKPLHELLPTILDNVLRSMPWSTSMRWPGAQHTWVRPIRNICCVLDGKEIVFDVPAAGLKTNNLTFGHRFLNPKQITVTSFAQYRQSLNDANIMLDFDERRSVIKANLQKICQASQLTFVADETLLDEVAGLVEYPFVGLGKIDDQFMHLPGAVLSTSMRVHQKYFTILSHNNYAPFFGFVANVPINEHMTAGYERVLRARLSDAAFFYDQDLKVPLESRLDALKNIIFHADLGSVHQKVQRLEFCAADPKVKQAARLCKCDLLTQMVGEFPELQGAMGEIYAKAQGVPSEIAVALKGYYQPQGANDDCPTDDVSWELSLLDKIDNLVGFLGFGMKPSGSKDPYGLRRSALGIIRLMLQKNTSNSLQGWLKKSVQSYQQQDISLKADVIENVIIFITERLSAFLKTEMPADHVYAVLDKPLEDVFQTVERARALKDLLQTDTGKSLLSAYRRVTGVLKGVQADQPNSQLFMHDAEQALYDALMQTAPKIDEYLKAFVFKEAMTLVANLKPVIDNFFDHVKVMDDDLKIQQNRLNLLGMLQSTLNAFANFSKLEG
ncbi:MAG: glycine--tRNA ligase subunit beta [Proteobacteria bacterium]|nr:glycine--tRNA ligase subunit beta [Pseudomonadota bacterium]